MKKLIVLFLLSATLLSCNKSNETPTPSGNKIVYEFKCNDEATYDITAMIKRDDIVIWQTTEERKNSVVITKYFELQKDDLLEFTSRTNDRFNHPTENKISVDGKVIRSFDKNCLGGVCNIFYRP